MELAVCASDVVSALPRDLSFRSCSLSAFWSQGCRKRHSLCEELWPACSPALSVYSFVPLLSSLPSALRFKPGSSSALKTFCCSVSIAKPWPLPLDKNCPHAHWPTLAAGYTGKGSASGCTCLARGSAPALHSAGLNPCPGLQGFSFAFVSSNPFPSGGGMGGVGMP